jgi:hypothetical protein
MRHGTVRIRLLITGKSILRKRAFPTHSVVSHRCPGNLFRGPRGARPPAAPHARPAAARAPHYCRLRARSRSGRPHAPLQPARPAAARTPHGRPRAPRPPLARPAADAAHTPRCRLRAPQSAARPAAARTPRGRPCAPQLRSLQRTSA